MCALCSGFANDVIRRWLNGGDMPGTEIAAMFGLSSDALARRVYLIRRRPQVERLRPVLVEARPTPQPLPPPAPVALVDRVIFVRTIEPAKPTSHVVPVFVPDPQVARLAKKLATARRELAKARLALKKANEQAARSVPAKPPPRRIETPVLRAHDSFRDELKSYRSGRVLPRRVA